MAATSLYDDVLDTKNVTSESPVALMPKFDSLVRSFQSARSGEVAAEASRGLGRHGWSKRSSTNGVGKRMEMERFNGRAKAEEQGAVAQVLDLAKAFERVSLLVVLARATHFIFPRKIWRVLHGYFEHQRRKQFEGCAAEPPHDVHGYPARVQAELFASAHCIAGCIE